MTPEKKPVNAILKGIIRTTSKGLGFVEVPGLEEDVFIEPEFVNTALNGDEVEIILEPTPTIERYNKGSGKLQQTGQVVTIINRAKLQFVGLVVHDPIAKSWTVKADDRKMYVPITIPTPDSTIQGKKVLVKISEWKKTDNYPHGEIIRVLGEKGDNETEIQSIILDRGINTTFPQAVIEEAEQLEKSEKPLNPEQIKKRKDFRNTLTFTIDPIDAKDFDDAISFKDLGDDTYEIGVHIADVSYYVREHTALDEEARKRALSVYLVDRTIPMLPEVLSNDLCSLNPHEEKFVFTASFVVNNQGEVIKRWFGKAVIVSDMRFSYESAQEVLHKKQGMYYPELNILNDIAKKLQRNNYNNGAIEFEQQEVKFKLDQHGKPIDVYKKERLDTHKLVESYMLLANREVAEFIFSSQKNSRGLASIYRIHDTPDTERMQELSLFLQALGYTLPVKQGKVLSQDINKLLKSVEGKPESALIKTATIRSMAKAVYSPKNIGHFGLAFKYYTHFTSPIRRYPDLMIHRILEDTLENNTKKVSDEFKLLEKISNYSTEKEIAAAEAERASIKYKQVEYMSEFIGKTFDGIISGVAEWGVYVEEARTKCEGMIPLRELGNDYFVFNRKTYSVQGQRTNKKFRLGDSVRFRVVNANLDAKTLDYALV